MATGREASTNEGPHVKIMEWDPLASNGKGKWKTIEKYFQADYKTSRKLMEQKIKRSKKLKINEQFFKSTFGRT